MTHYLSQCNIPVEIWHFNPMAQDDLYQSFKSIFQEIDDVTINL